MIYAIITYTNCE